MNKSPNFFRIVRDKEKDAWTVQPQELLKEPGEAVVIKGPSDANWSVWFDPAMDPRGPARPGADVEFTIRDDVPFLNPDDDGFPVKFKFTVVVDGKVLDPMIIINPPPN